MAERLARVFGEAGGGAGEPAGSGAVIVRAFRSGPDARPRPAEAGPGALPVGFSCSGFARGVRDTRRLGRPPTRERG
ncbi:hypothetical protein GCM10023215_57560 [Pseudonocardia yuanmonensis]|uniref:Uncharacterized protein n=1 Tax=Pseudonocardia yuanmonensis TaxID=1095914 RepID=A0ABP8XKE1_9PSEU